MKIKFFVTGIVALLVAGQVALADSPKVERNVGDDGIPVITITGDRAQTVQQPKPLEIPAARKAFRVYQLEGQSEPRTETKVVVLSSPPPIAPNIGYGYGYGWFGAGPYFGGFFPGSYYNGFSANYLNYQTAPVNYQNPPVNYQNPPVNYRPIPQTGFYQNRGFYQGGGFYRGGYCR